MNELCPYENQNRFPTPQIAGITKKQEVLEKTTLEKIPTWSPSKYKYQGLHVRIFFLL